MPTTHYKIVEDVDLTGIRETQSGYLTGTVRCAKTGIQNYRGSEFGRDQETFRLYRPEDEVFQEDSLKSFVGKPLTNDHPPIPVDSSNWKEFSVGSIGNEVMRDGEWIRVPITLMDGATIQAVKSGKRQLSVGYSVDIDDSSGVVDGSGEKYDAIMRNIDVNHLAVCHTARAGSMARIGDSWESFQSQPTQAKQPKKVNDMSDKLRKITLKDSGISIETTDQGVEAITKLQSDLQAANDSAETAKSDHKEALDSLKSDHDKVVSDKDEEIGKLKGQVKSLEDAAMTPEKLDVLVADRSELIGKASKIIKDGDFNGKSDADIMRLCVEKHHDITTDGESDDVVRGMFKVIKVSNDGFKDKFMNRKSTANVTQLSDSQAAYERRIANGGVDPK